jgi:hypothetical protein
MSSSRRPRPLQLDSLNIPDSTTTTTATPETPLRSKSNTNNVLREKETATPETPLRSKSSTNNVLREKESVRRNSNSSSHILRRMGNSPLHITSCEELEQPQQQQQQQHPQQQHLLPDPDSEVSLLSPLVRCMNCITSSTCCRVSRSVLTHTTPYLSAFALFILLIFCLWSLELYKSGQICGDSDIQQELGFIPSFFYKTRCRLSSNIQPIVPEQITEYTFILFNDFFQLLASMPGGSSIMSILGAIAPGVAVAKFADLCMFVYRTMTDEIMFSNSGFQNRVSITINTLEKREHGRHRKLEFEMRTIRDIALSELVPNEAAQRAIKQAGDNVEMNECGPVEFFELEKPCLSFNIAWFQRFICCINTRTKDYQPGGCCCCCHRCNLECPNPFRCCSRSMFYPCGKSKSEQYKCDPILRFSINPASIKMKDFVQDQITNILSESTSGSNFMGWEMGLNYKKIRYCWALTYETPLDPENTKRNRKFRILIAQRSLVDFAAANEKSWKVFHSKKNLKYTLYCDRRWSHLRKMGSILKARENQNLTESDTYFQQQQANKKRLNSFFMGDDLEVVSPILESSNGNDEDGLRLKKLIDGWNMHNRSNSTSSSNSSDGSCGGGIVEGSMHSMDQKREAVGSPRNHMNDFNDSFLSPRNHMNPFDAAEKLETEKNKGT